MAARRRWCIRSACWASAAGPWPFSATRETRTKSETGRRQANAGSPWRPGLGAGGVAAPGQAAGGGDDGNAMKAFAHLLDRLSYSPSRNAKLRLLVAYFR